MNIRGKDLARSLIVIILSSAYLAASLSPGLAQRPESAGDFEKSVQPFLEKNCYMCHSSQLKSGELNLEAYKTALGVVKDRVTWEHVLQKVRSGEMPPKGMPRPDEAELKAFTNWPRASLSAQTNLPNLIPGASQPAG